MSEPNSTSAFTETQLRFMADEARHEAELLARAADQLKSNPSQSPLWVFSSRSYVRGIESLQSFSKELRLALRLAAIGQPQTATSSKTRVPASGRPARRDALSSEVDALMQEGERNAPKRPPKKTARKKKSG